MLWALTQRSEGSADTFLPPKSGSGSMSVSGRIYALFSNSTASYQSHFKTLKRRTLEGCKAFSQKSSQEFSFQFLVWHKHIPDSEPRSQESKLSLQLCCSLQKYHRQKEAKSQGSFQWHLQTVKNYSCVQRCCYKVVRAPTELEQNHPGSTPSSVTCGHTEVSDIYCTLYISFPAVQHRTHSCLTGGKKVKNPLRDCRVLKHFPGSPPAARGKEETLSELWQFCLYK